MKQIVKTSRLAGQLEKIFRMLNNDFFNGQLEEPVITVQSTPKAYGHYTVNPIWAVGSEGNRHEINIGAGTLDRDIEYTVCTLLHEMCHYYNDSILHTQDCSRGGTYHNKQFKATAESVGLIVTKSDKYGWAHTSPSDALVEWIIDNNIQEIRMNREEPHGIRVTGGNATGNGSEIPLTGSKSHSRKYVCPCCGAIVRATKQVNVICGDCLRPMIKR